MDFQEGFYATTRKDVTMSLAMQSDMISNYRQKLKDPIDATSNFSRGPKSNKLKT